MSEKNREKSIFLSFLMLTSIMIGFVGALPTVAATNETSSGTITANPEIWSGSHTVTGDIVVATGGRLVIQPGTTITMPNGTMIDVRGGICAGDVACGANGMASNSSRITFNWQDPADPEAIGSCYGIFNNNHYNRDPSCNEGILLRSTVDIGATKLNHVTINNAYGMPLWVPEISEVRYGSLVTEGASPTLTGMKFTGINTTSLLILNLARPNIVGGEFTVGDDDSSLVGSAIQAYGAGSSLQPLTITNAIFTGTENGCGQNNDGRYGIWAEESFVDIQYSVIDGGDYGFRLDNSAGQVSSSTISTTCNGIDINNKKRAGDLSYKLTVTGNSIETDERSPLTAYNFAWVDFNNNVISGASEGSGIQISQSQVNVNGGAIGPIGGWNGVWSIGESDVRIENVTIQDTAQEPLVAGQYPWGSEGWKTLTENRMYVANSVITGQPSGCTSVKLWNGDFGCPGIHAYGASVSLMNNQFDISGGGDGIRAVGSILDVRNNDFNVSGTGATIKHHDTKVAGSQQYGSLGFFSMNNWMGVGQTYNITKSSVTVQSENIPIPSQSVNTSDPATLRWEGRQSCPGCSDTTGGDWATQVLVPETKIWPPQEFPLALEMTNNSTVFTYSNLTGLDTSNIYIDVSPSKWAVQIRKAEIVKFRTIVEGVRVGGTSVLVEDSHGDDIYSLTTDSQGWTPEISLASDFHLDFRGNGDNPDRYADDAGENSCSDGIDNDGDLIYDLDDPDCNAGANSREMSLYYVTAYKFGKGYKKYSLVMTSQTGVLSEIIPLENMDPTVSVSQNDGHSFKRSVNFTGSAHDGMWAGIYGSDDLAQWDQQGIVEQVQVKDPFTSDWLDARLATDSSGANGEVTYNNHPFRNWYFEYDMSDQPEGDYTFEFRAFDGVAESQIVTRTIKLNTEPPTIWVDGPADNSVIDEGVIQFTGRASDSYSGIFGSDIQRIWFEVEGPNNYYNLFDKPGGTAWSADWNVGHLPSGSYVVKIWASDSAFCLNTPDECNEVTLNLEFDNENALPVVQLLTPFEGQVITSSDDTLLSGVARDTDGTVTKVEITIRDPQAGIDPDGTGFLRLPDGPHSLVTDIQPNGGWATAWDTTQLVHNYNYIVEARSFDGFQYSDASSVQIKIDNPPNQDNNRPQFDSTDWPDSITIFCEETGTSADRCGNGKSIDLTQYFSDSDSGDSLQYYVLDQDIAADNDHVLIKVDDSGVATFNPIDMSYTYSDMADWSLQNVIFQVRDTAGSTASSAPIDFDVVGVSFSSQCAGLMVDGQFESGCPDELTKSDTLVYSGSGRPSVTIIGETEAGLRLASTVVQDDGTWMMEIPASRLEQGDNTIIFEYGTIEQPKNEDSVVNLGGTSDSGSALTTILVIIAIIVIIAVLGGVFVFFFVEFEEEPEEMMEPVAEADPYAWAKQNQQEQAAPQPVVQQQPVAAEPVVSGYPGWKWDSEQNKWVPDNQ